MRTEGSEGSGYLTRARSATNVRYCNAPGCSATFPVKFKEGRPRKWCPKHGGAPYLKRVDRGYGVASYYFPRALSE